MSLLFVIFCLLSIVFASNVPDYLQATYRSVGMSLVWVIGFLLAGGIAYFLFHFIFKKNAGSIGANGIEDIEGHDVQVIEITIQDVEPNQGQTILSASRVPETVENEHSTGQQMGANEEMSFDTVNGVDCIRTKNPSSCPPSGIVVYNYESPEALIWSCNNIWELLNIDHLFDILIVFMRN